MSKKILTGESVISALIRKITKTISKTDISEVYKERPLQGVEKPYAFIHQINAVHQREMAGRGDQFYTFDIRVHPADDEININQWARDIANKLLANVLELDVNGVVRSHGDVEWRVENDVLHFIISYRFKVVPSKVPNHLMLNIDYGSRLRKGE